MRKINKKHPISEFEQFVFRYHPTEWRQLPSEISAKSRFSILCDEQDCLCGYSEIPLEEDVSSSHIDHFFKRDLFPEKTFDWNNLIVSTIDEDYGGKYKDNRYKIKKTDYAQIFNPVNDDMSLFIEFSGDGSVVPINDINLEVKQKVNKTIEVFNLNCVSLKNRRKSLLIILNECMGLPREVIYNSFSKLGFVTLINWFLNNNNV